LFFYYFGFLIILFFYLNFIVNNLIFWWSIFVLITLTFIFLNKLNGSFSSSLNYFLIQEFLGFLFIIFSGFLLQFLILLIKIGVSPFHFWLYSVSSTLNNYNLIWFLTFQKIPFIPVLLFLFNYIYLFLLIFGLLICYIQIFILKNFKFIFIISSTESFNWLFFGLIFGIWGFTFLSIYYFFNIIFLIFYLNSINLTFIPLETILVFLNLPLSISFFLKIYLLKLVILVYDFLSLILLVLIFLSSLSFIGWFLSFSIKKIIDLKSYYTYYYFIIYILFFYIFF